jgi:predicted nuclease of predicted toxin-antitoxin system
MRFLANENFPRAAVEALRADGHDVSWIRTDAPGISDDAVLTRAHADGRVLLTFDKDVLRRGTHQPPKDVMELYTTVEWRKLCEEVAKLRISLPSPAGAPGAGRGVPQELGAGLGAVERKTPLAGGVRKWRRRESNPGPKDFS